MDGLRRVSRVHYGFRVYGPRSEGANVPAYVLDTYNWINLKDNVVLPKLQTLSRYFSLTWPTVSVYKRVNGFLTVERNGSAHGFLRE